MVSPESWQCDPVLFWYSHMHAAVTEPITRAGSAAPVLTECMKHDKSAPDRHGRPSAQSTVPHPVAVRTEFYFHGCVCLQARVDVKVVLLGSSGVGKTCLLDRCACYNALLGLVSDRVGHSPD